MPNEGQFIPSFNWRQVFPFIHIFRAFRIAIHPSKLALGLALVITVYLGGRILDGLWQTRYEAVPDEAVLYQQSNSQADFYSARQFLADNSRRGLFNTFFDYQVNQFTGIVDNVLSNQWFKTDESEGVAGHFYHFVITGPLWLLRVHPLYAVLFAILFIGAWSLFGGAIARLAAVHAARDEKLSLRAAMNFAIGKFLSFVSAPIIPLLIIIVVGVLLAIGALVGNIPFLGPIIIGGAFFLALIGGFVQALVIIGAVGGANLMYPTIAVEGSDSFDAISRSFSYIYARPWQMLFYSIVALAYGAITYLFVRLFILLMLVLAHHFVNMGMFARVHGTPLLPQIWPSPAATGRLTYHPDLAPLNWGQKLGAFFLSVWIHLIVGVLGAFAISFYFSANTIIYLLMRRELDATEMDDVYLDESDQDFAIDASADTVADTVAVEQITTPPAGAQITHGS